MLSNMHFLIIVKYKCFEEYITLSYMFEYITLSCMFEYITLSCMFEYITLSYMFCNRVPTSSGGQELFLDLFLSL